MNRNMYIAAELGKNLILQTCDKLKNKFKKSATFKGSNEMINVVNCCFVIKCLELHITMYERGQEKAGRINQGIFYWRRNKWMYC